MVQGDLPTQVCHNLPIVMDISYAIILVGHKNVVEILMITKAHTEEIDVYEHTKAQIKIAFYEIHAMFIS